MTDKLTIYNGALRKLGERRLASLSEDRAPRRFLDDAWDDGAIIYCLEQGNWTFATRSQKLETSTSLVPDFGFKYAFEKSEDWLSTVAVCSDEYYRNGIQYSEEAGIIYSDWNEIYVKFVSNDNNYGMNYALWSKAFEDYVQEYLASEISIPLRQKEYDPRKVEKARKEALNKNMKQKASQIMPLGTFAQARLTGGYRERKTTFSV
jgi:hypothetical protein